MVNNFIRIFPAYAGVSPNAVNLEAPYKNIPRVCGGEPTDGLHNYYDWQYSPRMRGWAWVGDESRVTDNIFPAYAGVSRKIGKARLSPCLFHRYNKVIPAVNYL